MEDCYFISDLHLLANRSNGHEYFEQIVARASEAAVFVLGGDIFDFRWARTASVGHAVDMAVLWLRGLAELCPDCQFHFLLGNHDYHQPFIDRLAGLDRRILNFSWDHYYFRRGCNVFLHGDVADRKMDAEKLAERRTRWLHKKKRGRVLNSLYDLAVSAKLHRPVPYLTYNRRLVARRIFAYLRDIEQGPDQGVQNVYFGHTHVPLSHYRYRGLVFHNGGASIKGVRLRILKAAPSLTATSADPARPGNGPTPAADERGP